MSIMRVVRVFLFEKSVRYGFACLFVAIASSSLCIELRSVSDSEGKLPIVLRDESMQLLEDQQDILAQERFLLAIDALPKQSNFFESSEEKEAFDSYFDEYEALLRSPYGTDDLLGRLQECLVQHPRYYSLLYFVAACHANLGHLMEFFDMVFKAVSYRPSCFMASKIVGVLHLRLSEGCTDESKRLKHRKEAIKYLKEAFRIEPRDTSLLMKLAFMLPESEKRDLVREMCSDILRHDKAMRRENCLYVIELAMSLSLYEEAKLLIDKARTWYEYSRALDRLSGELKKNPINNPR